MDFLNNLSIRTKILIGLLISLFIFFILTASQFNRLAYSEKRVKSLRYIEKATTSIQELATMNRDERALLLEMISNKSQQEVKRMYGYHVFTLNHTLNLYDSVFRYVKLIYEGSKNVEQMLILNSAQGTSSQIDKYLQSYFQNAYAIKEKQFQYGDDLYNLVKHKTPEDSTKEQSGIIPVEEQNFEGNTRSEQLLKLYSFYSKASSEVNQRYDEMLKYLYKEFELRSTEAISTNGKIKASNGLFLLIIVLLVLFILLLMNRVAFRPLKKLEKLALKLSKGELPEKTEKIDTKDEIGNMSQALSKLTDGLKKTSDFATEIGRRNFASDFEPLSERDVLGNVLLDMRKSLQVASNEENKRKIEDKERGWTTEGLALFGDILRKHTENISLLSKDVIKNLVRYLNVNQGGIFILNDTDPKNIFLELSSAYAYSREKFVNKRIMLGEGLVGGVAVEKYTVYMTDLPEEYIDIESGLGGSNPKSLLIVPLKLEEEVLGVIELASFNKMKKHEIELVERIAESIASTLSTTKINTTTAELLEQSRIREQDMQEREAEMKKSMMEMRATHKALTKKEKELSKEVEELEEIRVSTVEQNSKQTKRVENLTIENNKFKKDLSKLTSQITHIFDIDIFPIIIIDEYVKIKNFNKSAENITGYSRTELIGRGIDTIFEKKVAEEISGQVSLFFETHQESLIDREFSSNITGKQEENIPVKVKMREISIKDQNSLVMFINNLGAVKELENQRDSVQETLMSKEFDYSIRINSLEHFINQNGLTIPTDLEVSTDLMSWSVSHSIGLNIIDNQHKRWIEFINVLYKAYKLNSKTETIVEHIDKLLDYSDYHFGFEEKYMEDFKYDNIAQHVESHKDFVDTIRKLRTQYKHGDTGVLYKLIVSLHKLTAMHIEESREYVTCFKKNGLS